jgi:hypothetical protein
MEGNQISGGVQSALASSLYPQMKAASIRRVENGYIVGLDGTNGKLGRQDHAAKNLAEANEIISAYFKQD